MPIVVSILASDGVVLEVRSSQKGIKVRVIELDNIKDQIVRALGEDASRKEITAEYNRRTDEHTQMPFEIW